MVRSQGFVEIFQRILNGLKKHIFNNKIVCGRCLCTIGFPHIKGVVPALYDLPQIISCHSSGEIFCQSSFCFAADADSFICKVTYKVSHPEKMGLGISHHRFCSIQIVCTDQIAENSSNAHLFIAINQFCLVDRRILDGCTLKIFCRFCRKLFRILLSDKVHKKSQ